MGGGVSIFWLKIYNSIKLFYGGGIRNSKKEKTQIIYLGDSLLGSKKEKPYISWIIRTTIAYYLCTIHFNLVLFLLCFVVSLLM